jgi:hypothetical protein
MMSDLLEGQADQPKPTGYPLVGESGSELINFSGDIVPAARKILDAIERQTAILAQIGTIIAGQGAIHRDKTSAESVTLVDRHGRLVNVSLLPPDEPHAEGQTTLPISLQIQLPEQERSPKSG